MNDLAALRKRFMESLLAETEKKNYTEAFEGYVLCVEECTKLMTSNNEITQQAMQDFKGEALLRIAIIRKETDAYDLAMKTVSIVTEEPYNNALRANAFCLKGLLFEKDSQISMAEISYREALQLIEDHPIALERLGRVYMRYRETIANAVTCFNTCVKHNPSDHVAWYLLGRCYMATAQYTEAYDAYNLSVNLNSSNPQIWCSLGVLYYAFGQYKESLDMFKKALDLDITMADAWFNVGTLYDMDEQKEDAQMAYQNASQYGLIKLFVVQPGTTTLVPLLSQPNLIQNQSSTQTAASDSS